MKCPFCGFCESRVVDTRPSEDFITVRRRRECLSCFKRFTTYESIESLPIMVIKKDGSREVFSKSKIMNGLVKSCEKRPVSLIDLEKLVNDIEQEIANSLDREVSTKQIGEYVMQGLKELDEVAYVRFASVYRQFTDVGSFMEELERLMGERNKDKKEK